MAAETPISSRTMDDLDLMDSAFVVMVLSRGRSPLRARVTPLESYPGNKRSGAEQFGHDEHGESKTSDRLALIAGRHTPRRGRRFAVTVRSGHRFSSHLLRGWRHTAAYVW